MWVCVSMYHNFRCVCVCTLYTSLSSERNVYYISFDIYVFYIEFITCQIPSFKDVYETTPQTIVSDFLEYWNGLFAVQLWHMISLMSIAKKNLLETSDIGDKLMFIIHTLLSITRKHFFKITGTSWRNHVFSVLHIICLASSNFQPHDRMFTFTKYLKS